MFSQVFNISKDGDSTVSFGQLVPVFDNLHREKHFLIFKWNFFCSRLCPLLLVLSMGTTVKCLGPSPLLFPSIRYTLIHKDKILVGLQFSRLNRLISLSFIIWQILQSLNHLCDTELELLQYIHVSFVPWSPEPDIEPKCVSAGLSRGKGSPPLTCWQQSD